ncbi:hypothetical protein [uncultured Nonlabens sp.]|uniref:hypothetical protein n=1 Tax=uncultured Nonlabens sp. TaxID=859306 RepID=UPI0030D6E0B9|tara:strand:- start:6549 stop:7523 length:975 start_codon:yes stop_codon:yes gene_type:complete
MGTHQLTTLNSSDTFEDSICDLFNHLESTITYKRFGKNGHNQKGIDIFSTEKDCAIQCKKKDLSRKDILIRKEILKDIRKDVNKVINDKLEIKIDKLIFVSTYNDHPEIDEFCEILKKELNTEFEINYWGWDTLESKFLDQKELLNKYWSNFIIKTDSKESLFKRNLDLKKKISKDFGDWLNYLPEHRKLRSRMLLRDPAGNQYPDEHEPDEFGEYSWLRVEIKSLYHNGMEFIIGIEEIQVFEDNTWGFLQDGYKLEGDLVKVAKVGQINFADIVGYDIDGDEYGMFPHVYCEFKHRGTPFENIYYFNVDKTYQYFEIKDKRE